MPKKNATCNYTKSGARDINGVTFNSSPTTMLPVSTDEFETENHHSRIAPSPAGFGKS